MFIYLTPRSASKMDLSPTYVSYIPGLLPSRLINLSLLQTQTFQFVVPYCSSDIHELGFDDSEFNLWMENVALLQYSCLEKSHRQMSLVGWSPWGCRRVRHNRACVPILSVNKGCCSSQGITHTAAPTVSPEGTWDRIKRPPSSHQPPQHWPQPYTPTPPHPPPAPREDSGWKKHMILAPECWGASQHILVGFSSAKPSVNQAQPFRTWSIPRALKSMQWIQLLSQSLRTVEAMGGTAESNWWSLAVNL